MRKVSIKLKMKLGRLRKIQRDRQLEIEARLKNVEKIPSKYCPICKLYFRQSKIEHRDSEDHKKIRNFLRPYCKVCKSFEKIKMYDLKNDKMSFHNRSVVYSCQCQ